jgi:hypothetical protein
VPGWVWRKRSSAVDRQRALDRSTRLARNLRVVSGIRRANILQTEPLLEVVGWMVPYFTKLDALLAASLPA